MFVLSLVKKHYRLQFYMVWLNRGWLPPVGGRMMNNISCLEMLCRKIHASVLAVCCNAVPKESYCEQTVDLGR